MKMTAKIHIIITVIGLIFAYILTCLLFLGRVTLDEFKSSTFPAKAVPVENLYQNANGFINQNGQLMSNSVDPQIYIYNINEGLPYKYISIEIKHMTKLYSSAELYYKTTDKDFSEYYLIPFVARKGINIVKLPTTEYNDLRLDLTSQIGIGFELGDLKLLENCILPVTFYLVFFLMWLIFDIGLIFLLRYLLKILDTYSSRKQILDRIFTGLILIGYLILFFVMTELFYRQSVTYLGKYPSDLPLHIGNAISNLYNYSLVSLILKLLYGISHTTFYIAEFLSLIFVLTIYSTFYLLRYYLKTANKYLLHLFAVILNFIIPIYLPAINSNMYLGMQSPTVWHNSTYFCMKLVSIWIVFLFIHMYDKAGKIKGSKLILFAALLALINAIKPSFFIGFAPAVGIILVIDLLKSKGKTIRNVIGLSIAFLPSLLILLYQYIILFPPGSGNKTILGFANILKLYAQNPMASIIQSIAFPLIVLVVHFKDIVKDKLYRFIWIMAIFGLSELLFLQEEGIRSKDANFFWGYYSCVFFLFIYAIIKVYNDFTNKSYFERNVIIKKIYLFGSVLFLFWHFIDGIIYFLRILAGGNYW